MTSDRTCGCPGCNSEISARVNGVWYCNKHYQRMYHHGDLELHPKKNTNAVKDDGGDAVKVITANGAEILIDRDDIQAVMRHSWCISKTGYAVANIAGKTVKMHRYLLGLTQGKEVVDHINGNPLDNRRQNIRVCSAVDNARNIKKKKSNTSGHPGKRITPNGRFNVRITVNRKEIHIGNYTTMNEAVKARIEAEKQYYGEYAPSMCRL